MMKENYKVKKSEKLKKGKERKRARNICEINESSFMSGIWKG